MKICKAFKFRLKTNAEIEEKFRQFSGCCRFVWNKAWSINKKRIENNQPLIWYNEMCWFLTLWKKSIEYSFLKQANTQSLQQALRNLDRATKNGFDKKQPLKRMPRMKKRGRHDSFRYPQYFKLDGNRIYLPKIGWVRFFKNRPVEGTPRNITVSRKGKHWYVSIQTEMEVAEPIHPSSSIVGIDMGIARFVTLSDGSYLEPLNSFKKLEDKLAREQRKLAKKKKYSNNWHKQKARITKIHIRIADARKDYLNKDSTTISKNHAVVVLEDLRIKNMSGSAKGTSENPGKNVRAKAGLNKAILDQGWFEFRRQLEYKQLWRGGKVVAIPPKNTSRTCPECGFVSSKNRKTQSKFACECGYRNHADHVAAINILAAGQAVPACGEAALAVSTKQEPAGIRKVLLRQAA